MTVASFQIADSDVLTGLAGVDMSGVCSAEGLCALVAGSQ